MDPIFALPPRTRLMQTNVAVSVPQMQHRHVRQINPYTTEKGPLQTCVTVSNKNEKYNDNLSNQMRS